MSMLFRSMVSWTAFALSIAVLAWGCSSAPPPVEESTSEKEPTPLESSQAPEELCDGGDAEACLDLGRSLLGSMELENEEEAVQRLMQGCELGHAEACIMAGDAQMMGFPDESEETKQGGLNAFAEACRLDADSAGCPSVAHYRLRGPETMRDVDAGVEMLRDGCERDGGRSCRSLARVYYDGEGVERDLERALQYSKRGCVLEDSEACVDAGNRYRYGEGTEGDVSKALEYYEKACGLESFRGCLTWERFEEIVSCERQANLDCLERVDEPTPVQCPESEEAMFEPMTLPRDVWEGRRGTRTLDLRELDTSKEEPIETCQDIAYDWIANLRCNSGRSALGGHSMAAGSARLGSMGGGGRCGYVIDLYELSCPEGDYQVYVDWYFCPGE